MDQVGDFSVKRAGPWWRIRNRWTWLVLTEHNSGGVNLPSGVSFEGGWAHTRHGALNAVDEFLREIRSN